MANIFFSWVSSSLMVWIASTGSSFGFMLSGFSGEGFFMVELTVDVVEVGERIAAAAAAALAAENASSLFLAWFFPRTDFLRSDVEISSSSSAPRT